jgi:hypothetical protein
MFCEPILEKGIGDADRQLGTAIGQEGRGTKPCIEAMAVYLGLDPGEDLVPNARVHHDHFVPTFGNRLSPCVNGRRLERQGRENRREARKTLKSRDVIRRY